MEIRILGPVQAWAGGARLALGGARNEALLAALVFHAGRSVPLDVLIESAWERDPPATAARQIGNRVNGLRRLLTGAGFAADVLGRDRTGFVFRPGAATVDLAAFDRLCAQGFGVSRPRQAIRLLRAALELWRGPAFGGLNSGRMRAAAVGLEDRRLAALERCLDIELALGRHREVLGELAYLAGTHPGRERFAAQLLVALHRCGRRPDALGAYADASRRLREAVGVAPGGALRALHEWILHDDR